ncbi:hypothetical protein, partial [Enterococcus faecium]|uniref:hypothetical protein n=1 Tax=Enterococcus faecium TaxID=1352 RepID=UPI003977359E
ANTMLNGNMDTIVNGINEGADLYNNELPIIQQKLGLAADFIQGTAYLPTFFRKWVHVSLCSLKFGGECCTCNR